MSRDIYKHREEYKPFEYPEVVPLYEALDKTYWVPTEITWDGTIQEFNTMLTPYKQGVFKRTTLAISQVEVAVKAFWGELYSNLPKPEFSNLGASFSNNERAHTDTYSMSLEVLGLLNEFKEILEVPAFKKKYDLITKSMSKENKSFPERLLFFTLVIENSSLFSQFAIALSFFRFDGAMKDLSNMIGYTAFDEQCFPKDTKVLTPKGWKNIDKVKIGDEVYGFKEGILKIEKVINTTKKLFEGNLIETGNSKHNLLTTPDHDMLLVKNKKWLKEEAGVANYNNASVPVTADFQTNKNSYKLTPLDRLKIAIQADGSRIYWTNTKGEKINRGNNGGATYKVAIYKERKIKNFREIIRDLEGSIRIEERPLKNGVSFQIYLDTEGDLKSLDWVLTSPIISTKESSDSFINEVLKWDGHISESIKCYSSTSLQCVEVVEQVAILAGYRTSIYKSEDSKRSENFNDTYKLNLSQKDKGLVSSHSYKKKLVPYKGEVSCVTVPSGGIMVKQGYKTPFITGNCHAQAGIMILNFLREEGHNIHTENIAETVKEYIEIERGVLEWIFQGEDLVFTSPNGSIKATLTVELLLNYLKDRLDKALVQIGEEKIFNIHPDQISNMFWFEEEVNANALDDFFAKRPTEYTKNDKSFTGDDLF